MTMVIRFDDVHRHFGTVPVLRGLSFTVAKGQVFAFLGRNGAGKTTALRILLGLLRPHAGRAELLGQDSQALRPADRGRVGYVGEGHRLDPTLRVADTLLFEQGTRPDFRRGFADQAVQRCGLLPRQRIGTLSRGQRAQLSLIVAVAGAPELLVFDDPAMGLDAVMRREFLDAMIDLLAESGCAVLFSSHILGDVERIADRVGILHGGGLVVDAPLDELKRRLQRRRLDCAGVPAFADPRVLRVSARRDGVDVLLRDADDALLALLAAHGRLGEPEVPSLEQLFLDLTGPDRPGMLSAPFAALTGKQEVIS
jgi:ABC-2 type transport system ATP-binding protein